jgi:hypothetical protein
MIVDEDNDVEVCGTSVRWQGDWEVISALVKQVENKYAKYRWQTMYHSKIDLTRIMRSAWTVDKDTKLKDAVRAHGAKN